MNTGFPTTLVAAAVVLIVGVICNVKGWHYDESSKLLLTQCVGVMCDAVAAVLAWVHGLHAATTNALKALYVRNGLTPPKLALGGVLLLAFCTQGCASYTPAQNVSLAEQGFTALTIGLNTARAAHQIDDQAWAVISIGITAGNDYLDVLDTKVASGEITTNQQLLKSAAWLALQEVLNQLTAYQQKATMVQGGRRNNRPTSRNTRVSTSRDDHYRPTVERGRAYSRAASTNYRRAA